MANFVCPDCGTDVVFEGEDKIEDFLCERCNGAYCANCVYSCEMCKEEHCEWCLYRTPDGDVVCKDCCYRWKKILNDLII